MSQWKFVFFYILFFLQRLTDGQYQQQLPSVACPNIFQYVTYEGQTIGRITLLASPGTTVVDVTLSQQHPVQSDYLGSLSLLESRTQTIDNIFRGEPIYYRVDFPFINVVPKLTEIAVNNSIICSARPYPPPSTKLMLRNTITTTTTTTTTAYRTPYPMSNEIEQITRRAQSSRGGTSTNWQEESNEQTWPTSRPQPHKDRKQDESIEAMRPILQGFEYQLPHNQESSNEMIAIAQRPSRKKTQMNSKTSTREDLDQERNQLGGLDTSASGVRRSQYEQDQQSKTVSIPQVFATSQSPPRSKKKNNIAREQSNEIMLEIDPQMKRKTTKQDLDTMNEPEKNWQDKEEDLSSVEISSQYDQSSLSKRKSNQHRKKEEIPGINHTIKPSRNLQNEDHKESGEDLSQPNHVRSQSGTRQTALGVFPNSHDKSPSQRENSFKEQSAEEERRSESKMKSDPNQATHSSGQRLNENQQPRRNSQSQSSGNKRRKDTNQNRSNENMDQPLRPNTEAESRRLNKQGQSDMSDELQIISPQPSRAQRQAHSINVTDCGRPTMEEQITTRIVGGTLVERGQFPWLVAIYDNSPQSLKFRCGGSLISSQTIISAAHCFEYMGIIKTAEETLIIMGRHDLMDWNESTSATRTVQNVTLHPEYKGGRDGSFDADIAVIIIHQKVSFNDMIKPICLRAESSDSQSIVGLDAVVVGWGHDNDGHFTALPNMVQTTVVSEATCLRSKKGFQILTSNRTLCAGKRDGTGPCTGDSGNGLIFNRNGRWFLIGTVSASLSTANDKCNLREFVVYSDVSKFVSWIQSFML